VSFFHIHRLQEQQHFVLIEKSLVGARESVLHPIILSVHPRHAQILPLLLDQVDQRVSSHPRCVVQHIFHEQRLLELSPSWLGVLDLDDALMDLWFYHPLETSYLGLILNVSLLHLVPIRGKELRDILAIKSASNLNRLINCFIDQRLSLSCF
jgi:hypothetical protein